MLLNSADANGGLDDTNPSSNPNPSPSPSSSPHPSLSPNSNPIPNQADSTTICGRGWRCVAVRSE